MPVLEAVGTVAWLAFPLPLLLGAWMTTKMTAKDATDRIASFLPTATTAAFQLILSAYPQNGVCTVGQVYSRALRAESARGPPKGRRCTVTRHYTGVHARSSP